MAQKDSSSIVGKYKGKYGDLGGKGSWEDGWVEIDLDPDGTARVSRQSNSGRDDSGSTDKLSGSWHLDGDSVILTDGAAHKDFNGPLKVVEGKLELNITHQTPGPNMLTDMVLEKQWSIVGKYKGEYGDLGGKGSWEDGCVELDLDQDGTARVSRQSNSGRDDEGRTHKVSGKWNLDGDSVILTDGAAYKDFNGPLKVVEGKLQLNITHRTPGPDMLTDMVLEKQ